MSGAGRSAASARVGVGGMPSGDAGAGRARELGRDAGEAWCSARRADGAADSRGPHVREKGGARTQDERGAGELGLGRLARLRRRGALGWDVEFGLEGKERGLGRRCGLGRFGLVWVFYFFLFSISFSFSN